MKGFKEHINEKLLKQEKKKYAMYFNPTKEEFEILKDFKMGRPTPASYDREIDIIRFLYNIHSEGLYIAAGGIIHNDMRSLIVLKHKAKLGDDYTERIAWVQGEWHREYHTGKFYFGSIRSDIAEPKVYNPLLKKVKDTIRKLGLPTK